MRYIKKINFVLIGFLLPFVFSCDKSASDSGSTCIIKSVSGGPNNLVTYTYDENKHLSMIVYQRLHLTDTFRMFYNSLGRMERQDVNENYMTYEYDGSGKVISTKSYYQGSLRETITYTWNGNSAEYVSSLHPDWRSTLQITMDGENATSVIRTDYFSIDTEDNYSSVITEYSKFDTNLSPDYLLSLRGYNTSPWIPVSKNNPGLITSYRLAVYDGEGHISEYTTWVPHITLNRAQVVESRTGITQEPEYFEYFNCR